jgi:molybdopterin-guanine dinucleotide biosynthesis protein B
MIASPKKLALVSDIDSELTLQEVVSRYVQDVDLLIAEGYKGEDVPRIEVYSSDSAEPPVSPGHRNLLALVADTPIDAPVPVLGRDDVADLAALIMERLGLGPRAAG